MKIGISTAIRKGLWAIEPNFAHSYLPTVAKILKGEYRAEESPTKEEEEENVLKSFSFFGKDKKGDIVLIDEEVSSEFNEVVAKINIQGPIVKNDTWCDVGTATHIKTLQLLAREDAVKAIVLDIDSGGGEVDGTKNLADSIKELSKLKPIVAFVNGIGASAAYWIASAADKVVLSNDTDRVGSIGTMIGFWDWTKYYEEKGINWIDAYASESVDKNQDFMQLLEGNSEPIINNSLNPMNAIFLDAIRSNRPKAKEETLTGKMYLAKDAVEKGLADEIKSIDAVISDLLKEESKTIIFKI